MMRTFAVTAVAAMLIPFGAGAQSVQMEERTDSELPSAQGELEQRPGGGFEATGEARMANTMTTDIVDVLTGEGDFSTLATAVQQAGLIEKLKSDGPFTVFAPTNRAFDKLSDEEMKAIMGSEERLIGLLQGHVVEGAIQSGDLEDGQEVETLAGDTLSVDMTDGTVQVGDAQVMVTDIVASNGVIHVIDTVLSEEQPAGQ